MHRILASLLLILGMAACAATPPAGDDRAPPEKSGLKASATDAPKVDRSCASDADCTVKNVGNCCGYYPACVNVDSETFPERVKAECERKGMSSVCGFPSIDGCQCVQGQCEAAASGSIDGGAR